MSTRLKWGLFGERTINMLGQVRPGEVVLILADTWTNMDIAEACFNAALAADTDAQLLIFPWQSSTSGKVFGPALSGAIMGADLVVGLCPTMFAQQAVCREARAQGTRIIATVPNGIEDYVIKAIVDVDYEAMVENGKRMCALFEQTKHCHITCPLGTDITMEFTGRPALLGDGMATEPGELDFFPGVQVSNAPIEETINGVAVIDGSISPGGLVSAPVTIRVERGRIVEISGGVDASSWQQRLEATGDPKIFELCHLSIGLNPRARMSGNMIEDERVVGCVDFGFGNQDPKFEGKVGSSRYHVDVVLASPTVMLDDTVLCSKNTLNYELGFVKVA